MEDELDAISRGEEPWITPLEKFWKPFITQVEQIEKTVSREEVAKARDLGIRPVRAARCRCAWAASDPSCRPAPRTMRRSRSSRACGPDRRWTRSRWQQALELFKLPRTLGSTADGEHCHGSDRTLRPVRQVRRQVRVAEGRRPVHGYAREGDRGDRGQEGRRRQPPHHRISASTTSRCSTAAMARTSPTGNATPASPRTATPSR